MNKSILITGSLGSFGRVLTEELMKNYEFVNLLVRAKADLQPVDRVKAVFGDAAMHKIKVFQCDLKEENLGLSKTDYQSLTKETTHILHAAASTRFDLTISEARDSNVKTVENILVFAENCHQLKKLGFVSTAFVAGKRKGVIHENELEHNEGFLNTYEESKYEAEKIIQTKKGKLPIIIFRPSLVATTSKGDDGNPMNAVVLGLKLIRKGLLPVLPGEDTDRLDIITSTNAAKKISELFHKDINLQDTYHIVSSLESPTIRDLINIVSKTSSQKIQVKFCGEIMSFTKEVEKITKLYPDLATVYQKVSSFIPELAFPKIFDDHNVLQELGKDANSLKNLEEAITKAIT